MVKPTGKIKLLPFQGQHFLTSIPYTSGSQTVRWGFLPGEPWTITIFDNLFFSYFSITIRWCRYSTI